jgi:hypothetical protein
MDTLVLRPTPGPLRLVVNLLVGTVAVVLLTMCAYGSDKPPSDAAVVMIGSGLVAFLAALTALAIRNYHASTLRLSREALVIGKRTIAWTDIEEFARVPKFIRVRYVDGCERGRAATITETLGRIGVYFPPTYLSAAYDTGDGGDLYDILQRRRRLAAREGMRR